MKKSFITGLALLLPVALTIAIVVFIVDLFTAPFIDAVRALLDNYRIFEYGFWLFSAEQLELYVSKVLILALLFFVTVFLGWLTRWVVIHYLIRLNDYILHRIPFVRTIYKTSQDVIKTIFGQDTRSFKQVVLVPFPNKQTYSIGLVTRDELTLTSAGRSKSVVAVFVPTTPNPTSGFLLMYDRKDLVPLSISVEEAFKYVVSCGVIAPSFSNEQPVVEE